MKKHDFKKLALLGLAGGLFASASPVEALDISSSMPIAHTGCGGKKGCGHYSNANGQGQDEVAEADEDYSTQTTDRVQSGCPGHSGSQGQSNQQQIRNRNPQNDQSAQNTQRRPQPQPTSQNPNGQQGYNAGCSANSSSNGQKTYTR